MSNTITKSRLLVYDLNIKEPAQQKSWGARFLDDSNNRK